MEVRFGETGAGGPLKELQHLQQLTHLSLSGMLRRTDQHALAACRALTASSKLQHLDLSYCQLPEPLGGYSVWQFMLPADKQLPDLLRLYLQHSGNAAMWPTDVASLTRCCANLEVLHMPPLAGQPADAFAHLCGLTGLQELSVRGSTIDDAALAVLAQLTGLTYLNVGHLPGTTFSGVRSMLPLTRLRQLRRLSGGVGDAGDFNICFHHVGHLPWNTLVRLDAVLYSIVAQTAARGGNTWVMPSLALTQPLLQAPRHDVFMSHDEKFSWHVFQPGVGMPHPVLGQSKPWLLLVNSVLDC